jgi:spore germination cell wall hydrolase CwlJ-like protein
MKALGMEALKRGHLAFVGAISLIGLGISPAMPVAPIAQDTDKPLSIAHVRAGFLAAMPDLNSDEDAQASETVRKSSGVGVTRRRPKPAQMIAKVSASEQRCLAEALYYEARGESHDGQMAVAEVVIRRSKTRGYPGTICGVVYQGNPGGTTGCQFSFVCNGAMKRSREPGAWKRAKVLATRIGTGKVAIGHYTDRALFFHATSVRPHWPGLVRTAQVGKHVFYRRNAGWRGTGAAGRRLRYRGSAVQAETAVETTPAGGVLLPDGRIESVIAPAQGIDITVRPEMDAGA